MITDEEFERAYKFLIGFHPRELNTGTGLPQLKQLDAAHHTVIVYAREKANEVRILQEHVRAYATSMDEAMDSANAVGFREGYKKALEEKKG